MSFSLLRIPRTKCECPPLAISHLNKTTIPNFKLDCGKLKGIVSRVFEWLQMILMNRLCVPDVPLEVYSFINLHLHIVFFIFKFTAG